MTAQAWAAALSSALPDADIVAGGGATGMWLIGEDARPGPFRLVTVQGRPCLWHPDRVAEVARDLDAAADLLDRVEAVSGWRFEPAHLTEQRQDEVVCVRHDGTALELALDGCATVSPTLLRAAAAAPARSDRPCAMTLWLTGPSLPVAEATGLEVGDLLLLPRSAAVRVSELDLPPMQLDLSNGRVSTNQWPASGTKPAFEVRLDIALAPLPIVPDALKLVPQGVPLELGPLPDGLEASVHAGGRSVATGTVVAFGDGYAVRLEALNHMMEADA